MNEVVDLSNDEPVSTKETDFFDDDEDDAFYAAVDQIEQLRVQQEEAIKQQKDGRHNGSLAEFSLTVLAGFLVLSYFIS